ncbi:MAG: hypothetical protein C4290_01125 [Chloroflexota bacterium]
MSGVLPQIWLRLVSDPAFAAGLRADFAGTLLREGYMEGLEVQELPAVFGWHRALRDGALPHQLPAPTGLAPGPPVAAVARSSA